MRIVLTFLILASVPSAAGAHLGHLGEVAGHSHWIALGAGVVAAAVAALLAKSRAEAEKNEEAEETAEEQDAEPAEA